MSQTIDEQLRRAFNAVAEQIRTSVSDQLSLAADRVIAAVASDRRDAVEAAARQTAATIEQEVVARLDGEFLRHEEELKESARAEWFDAGLKQARSETSALQEAHAAEMRANADILANLTAEAAEATAAGRAATDRAAHYRSAVERLSNAMQTLDASVSLSQTLDALAASATPEVARMVLLLVRGEVLRPWSHAGFTDDALQASADIRAEQTGVISDAIRTGSVQRVSGPATGRPAFAGASTTAGTFVAVPLTMNGQVIAVLCGDELQATDNGDLVAWTFEVLARHAARVLELHTALRLAQLGTHPWSAHAGTMR
jgi:membrane carboxypeptidase/penicillin-binding protein